MNKSAPKVKRIVDPPKKKMKPLHPNVPQTPALVLLIMPVKCGKSTIISNMLLNDNFYGQDYFDNVKVISTTINNDLTSRFLKQAYDCEDYYDDNMISSIVKSQKKFGEVSNMPLQALIVDDCLGEKTPALTKLSSRYRHSNIGLLAISSQAIKKVAPTIRANATNCFIGKLTSSMELDKVCDEYAQMYADERGGDHNFRDLYNKATEKKYDFLHLNLQENPAEAFINMETKIWPPEKSEPEPEILNE
tara:strand:- start:1345 stop:2088 length:744 start_codon:yes stop_codon:yes gene_type:complete